MVPEAPEPPHLHIQFGDGKVIDHIENYTRRDLTLNAAPRGNSGRPLCGGGDVSGVLSGVSPCGGWPWE